MRLDRVVLEGIELGGKCQIQNQTVTLIQLSSRLVQVLFHFLQRAPRDNSLYEILVVEQWKIMELYSSN